MIKIGYKKLPFDHGYESKGSDRGVEILLCYFIKSLSRI